MDAFHALFVHYTNIQVIVCKDCKSAVVPNQVKTHLKQSHGLLTAKTRDEIAQHVHQLDHVAYRNEDVQYPVFEEEAIPELGPALEDCFQCKECNSLRESSKGIEKHCREEHGWACSKSRRGKGGLRSRPARNQPFTEGHRCQRFFRFRQWNKLFKVLPVRQQAQTEDRAA